VQLRRAYKFRAYPTRPQEARAVRLLADHCDLYNAALEERREAWRMRKASITYGTQSAQLKQIRHTDPEEQGRHSFTAQQQTLRRLAAVFRAFYNRCQAGQQPGYPRFKPHSRFDQVRNRRRDFHHKTARALVSTCDAIALERLQVANMTHRPKPRPDPARPGAYLPNGAAAKSGLNKAVLDVGWAQFTTILAGKAEEAGRHMILVNPVGTSISCHRCGRRCTRPRQDTVICPLHGPMDADVNGARNVYARAGLGSGQAAPAA
jgi:transposase